MYGLNPVWVDAGIRLNHPHELLGAYDRLRGLRDGNHWERLSRYLTRVNGTLLSQPLHVVDGVLTDKLLMTFAQGCSGLSLASGD